MKVESGGAGGEHRPQGRVRAFSASPRRVRTHAHDPRTRALTLSHLNLAPVGALVQLDQGIAAPPALDRRVQNGLGFDAVGAVRLRKAYDGLGGDEAVDKGLGGGHGGCTDECVRGLTHLKGNGIAMRSCDVCTVPMGAHTDAPDKAPGPRPPGPGPIENPMLANATVSASRPGGGTGPATLVRRAWAGVFALFSVSTSRLATSPTPDLPPALPLSSQLSSQLADAPPPPSRRGKIPLEKGFSQMDWLRRGRERAGKERGKRERERESFLHPSIPCALSPLSHSLSSLPHPYSHPPTPTRGDAGRHSGRCVWRRLLGGPARQGVRPGALPRVPPGRGGPAGARGGHGLHGRLQRRARLGERGRPVGVLPGGAAG
jgi:hypothetical protein